jgi:hypothetical protein
VAAATLMGMSTPAHAAYTTPFISVQTPPEYSGITKALIALDPGEHGQVVLGGRTGGSHLYTCGNAGNQRWEKLPNGTSGWTQPRNVAGATWLDVKGPSFSGAATIHVWDCYSSWSRRWNILP